MTTLPTCSQHRSPQPMRRHLEEHALHAEIDGLRRAIEGRAVIERAKGALMGRLDIDEAAAFALLRRWSMASQIKLKVLASAVLALIAGERPGSTASDDPLHVVDREIRALGESPAPS